MPIVHVEIREGKSPQHKKAILDGVHAALVEAKKKLYRAIADRLAASPGIAGADLTVVLAEPPLEDWGIRGGKPADEADIGFDINV
jgi:phenylpyruvate tautomerase PptA (4-oxalocrotonate tautomerase family)